jgi:hypothetical protein
MPDPRPVELLHSDDLVEHDRACGYIDGTNPRALRTALVGDYHTIIEHALPGSYPALEGVLPDVGEHLPVGAEVTEDFFQLVWVGVSHPSRPGWPISRTRAPKN